MQNKSCFGNLHYLYRLKYSDFLEVEFEFTWVQILNISTPYAAYYK